MKSILLSSEQINKIKGEFKNSLFSDSNQYIDFNIVTNDLKATCYTSGMFVLAKDNINLYEKIVRENNTLPIIGCDETGVGDLLLPVVAACVYLDEKALDLILNSGLNITDSKKISDENITKIFKKLSPKIKHSITVIPNEQYNMMIDKGFNSHEINTFVHAKNILNFSESINVIMDQYASSKSFEKYLSKLNMQITNKILFEEKADNKYISVALASIFARYAMLQSKHTLENELNMSIPFGAGGNVVITCEEIAEKKALVIYQK